MRRVDHIFSPAVREELILEGPDGGFSGDLTAINVQRGRDHGLPPYVEFLKACGKPRIKTFRQLCGLRVMSRTAARRLRRAYRSVRDIDLFAGAMNEFPSRGSAVGFTFRCILTQQFRNLRRGDRFWYETNDQKVGFTLRQLKQIRKVTLARVLCDNLDGYRWSQPRAFVLPNRRNRFRACSRIRAMNFTPFKEESSMADESNEAKDAALVEADSALVDDEPEMEPIPDEPEGELTPDEREVALIPDETEVEEILGEPEEALTSDEAEAALFDDAADEVST